MPCSDSSSSIVLQLNQDEKFLNFDFAKITCGQEITANTGYAQYCLKKSLDEILNFSYEQLRKDLNITEEDVQFILYSEWDALRTVIMQYLGREDENMDIDRCQITAVEHSEEGVEIALVILPPKEMPKIFSCHLT
ncbi:hypothetical protein MNBD_UNCLBAC01-2172 [hydrothermal vent metagenome]|uniref:NIF system FeS cluster assembly NifU N-terminal domain-containing protein n=1 Tax=hydrothermal vent metagenome TaxID=652676 RepID=A0A3B1DM54_9ZZZZ